jgi:hypothetical protein
MKLLNSIILALALLVSMGWAEDIAFCDAFACELIDNDILYKQFEAEFKYIQRGDKNCQITLHKSFWEEQIPLDNLSNDDVVAQVTAVVMCDKYDSKKLPAYIRGAARFALSRDKGTKGRVVYYIMPVTARQLL